ncbi:potassium channel family protein [Pseudomonas sp. NA-150]|uniref:potassium channel family protein n=1 Tax=Pseudomonas sp. NA-150 TaxID=3367525 RepID=UPI0037C9558D
MRPIVRGLIASLLSNSLVALLLLIVLMVFVLPFLSTQNSLVGRIIQDLLFALVLLNGLILLMDRHKGLILTPVALVALLAIGVRGIGWLFPDSFTVEIREGTTLLALALISVATAMKVFASGVVTLDRISGAVALYVLMGTVWAEAYQLVILNHPGAFSGSTLAETTSDRSIWIYFSFVTLTTVGYGDIVPVAPAARSLANLEALIGQLYPAIVLARLVSLQVPRASSDPNKP